MNNFFDLTDNTNDSSMMEREVSKLRGEMLVREETLEREKNRFAMSLQGKDIIREQDRIIIEYVQHNKRKGWQNVISFFKKLFKGGNSDI